MNDSRRNTRPERRNQLVEDVRWMRDLTIFCNQCWYGTYLGHLGLSVVNLALSMGQSQNAWDIKNYQHSNEFMTVSTIFDLERPSKFKL